MLKDWWDFKLIAVSIYIYIDGDADLQNSSSGKTLQENIL